MIVRRAVEPRCHHGDSADDQGGHRRAGAPPGSAAACGCSARRRWASASRRRCCGSSAAGWWPAATMGVEADIRKDLYARLQILPMSFHGRWQSGQLLSRMMNDLEHDSPVHVVRHGVPAAQRHPDHRRDGDPARACTGRWAWWCCCRSCRSPLTVLHFQREYTRLSRLAQDQSGDVATHVEEAALGLRVVKSFGREDYVFDRFDEQLTDLYDTQVQQGHGVGEVLDAARGHPEPHADRRAGLRRATPPATACVTMGTLVAFITMMLSLVWPIASLGFLLSMTQEAMTAANRIAEIFDAPPRSPTARAARRRAAAASNSSTSASGSPTRERHDGRCAHVNLTVEPGRDAGAGRRDRIGQVGAHRAAVAALRRHRGRDPHRRRTTSATCRLPALRRAVATAFEEPTLFSMSVARTSRSGRPDATDGGDRRRPSRSPRPVRLRPAVGARHPHRRAGHDPVRRPAAAAGAGAGGPRGARGAGARRHAVRARRAHRGRRRGGAAPGAARGHRHRRRAPGVDGAAGRPGRAARGRHHHPRRHARRTARDGAAVPRPAGRRRRARRRPSELRMADDETAAGSSTDDEQEADRAPTSPRVGRRGRAQTAPIDATHDDRGAAWPSTRRRRRPAHRRGAARAAARPARCSDRLLRPYQRDGRAAGHRRGGGERRAPVGSAAGAARHRPRHPAARRRRSGARAAW